ncbi:MAG: FHA domain-containing protein [Anaerolineae bacterium]|nr:FHA domain-containing protein [Anaerolineae bacterium]
MTSQSIYIPSKSETLSPSRKLADVKPAPINTIRLGGTTKRLTDHAVLQNQPPITFLLIDADITVSVQLADQAFIGRHDDDFEFQDRLDIDLMPYEAREKGVSRRHAMLCRISNRLCIIDLKSTNGTYVNGFRLVPDKPFFCGTVMKSVLGK